MDIAQGNPPTGTRHTFSSRTTFSECSVVYSASESLYPFHVQPLLGGAARRQTTTSKVLSMAVTEDCGHHSISVSWIINAVHNLHNLHVWATENPQDT